jgi:hypothetical protein
VVQDFPALNNARIARLLRDAVGKFTIAMRSRTILTEAGTNYFSVTPVLAALGGAEKVYALTRDSRYGRAEAIKSETMALAWQLGVAARIEILCDRKDPRLGEADIVTNLGFVRPIDRALLDRLKEAVVIPLMWETWEYRKQDLDLGLCRERGIPVLGTNEHHPKLDTFRYVGQVALKLLQELDVEIVGSRIAVLGGGEFADRTVQTLESVGARCFALVAETLARSESEFADADALVVVEHHIRQELIGEQGLISAKRLGQINPGLAIAHISGGVSQRDLEGARLEFLPRTIAPAGFMSASTAYVGPKPVIELHAAGLAVGQAMAEAVAGGLRGLAAERRALERCEFAQGFDGRH